jgi:hypothetical protein|tara:strand:- start:159 stop:392 length:234 start_codon:yes stop_codon:yes gene_type:complete
MLHGNIGEHGITPELITWLEEIVPDKLPPLSCSIEDVRYLQGQQKIIDIIKCTYKSSTKEQEESSRDSITILTAPDN